MLGKLRPKKKRGTLSLSFFSMTKHHQHFTAEIFFTDESEFQHYTFSWRAYVSRRPHEVGLTYVR